MADNEVRRRSITRDDVGDKRGAVVWQWVVPYNTRSQIPTYWSPARDHKLRLLLYEDFHDMWGGAIGIAVTKMASLAWELESAQEQTRDYFQDLLLAADDNQSWVKFLSRHLQDFLGTDNGAFVEVVRATNAAGSRILGLMHLDSLRCTRTGDPDTPVLYRDTLGKIHEVQAHQVLMFADMPSPSETYHGVGWCATSRALGAIRKLEAVERYIYEKISGDRALAVDFVGGVLEKDITAAVDSAHEANEARGNTSYLGAIMIPVPGDAPITHQRINFAELPDGFVYDTQVNNAVLVMANAIGLDVQDLQPLTGRPLGTAMQSQVLEDKSEGRGLAAWRQQFTHLVNQYLLPDAVTFAFSEKDLNQQKRKAEVDKTNADMAATLVEKAILTSAQAMQLLADAEVIPQEFVPEDTTPREAIADTEKPEVEQDAQAQAAEQQPEPEPEPAATTKELDTLRLQFAEAMGQFKQAMAQPPREDAPGMFERLKEWFAHKEQTPPPQPVTIPVTVNVPPPVVNVGAPNVTMEPAQVTVNVPPQEPPVVTFKQAEPIVIPAPIVNVTNDVQPTPVVIQNNTTNVITPTQQTVVEVVKRDQFGRIEKVERSDENAIKPD